VWLKKGQIEGVILNEGDDMDILNDRSGFKIQPLLGTTQEERGK